MDAERLAPTVGIVDALLLVIAVAIPAVTVEGEDGQVTAYYAASPVGISFVRMLALFETVVFLSGRQEQTDPATAAGFAPVLSLSMLGIAALWSFSIDQTPLFSFNRQYSWLTYHRWSVVAAAFVTFIGDAWYTRGVLWAGSDRPGPATHGTGTSNHPNGAPRLSRTRVERPLTVGG